MDLIDFEYKIINCFWKVALFGMFMWMIRNSSEIEQSIFLILGLVWILHSFGVSIVKLYRWDGRLNIKSICDKLRG